MKVLNDLFDIEIEKLKDQFTNLRFQVIQKEQFMVKFMQIAYDQEMYMNEIRRMISMNLFEKAQKVIENTPSVNIGSIISQTTNDEFNIRDQLAESTYQLAGTHYISQLHDPSKVIKRVNFSMNIDNTIADVSTGLDSRFISKTRK